jgi:hypothetical protein
MRVIAFSGPSLTADDRADFAGVEWRPPAQAGDLLELEPEPGLVVCLIDGYFDHRPAVRHKEILLLLSEGVCIFGAASIGALRAAEMSSFGMIGIGSIHRAYADGRLVGDDEVALVHATGERDWRPLSLPLVDARATVCRAVRERILRLPEARAILCAAAGIHYVDRIWKLVIDSAFLPVEAREAFGAWLVSGEVAQKRRDALACVRMALSGGKPDGPRPTLVPTVYLMSLARERGISLEGRL